MSDIDTCTCGNPEEPGMHWTEGDPCCPGGCKCADCEAWYPYLNIKLEGKIRE